MLDQKISADIMSNFGPVVLRACQLSYANGFLEALQKVPNSHLGLWWDKLHLQIIRELKEAEGE